VAGFDNSRGSLTLNPPEDESSNGLVAFTLVGFSVNGEGEEEFTQVAFVGPIDITIDGDNDEDSFVEVEFFSPPNPVPFEAAREFEDESQLEVAFIDGDAEGPIIFGELSLVLINNDFSFIGGPDFSDEFLDGFYLAGIPTPDTDLANLMAGDISGFYFGFSFFEPLGEDFNYFMFLEANFAPGTWAGVFFTESFECGGCDEPENVGNFIAFGTITGADFINDPAGLDEDTGGFLDDAIDEFATGEFETFEFSEGDLDDAIASIEGDVIGEGGQVNGLVEGTFLGPSGVEEELFAPAFAIGQIDVTLEFDLDGFETVAETKDLFIALEGVLD